uniref:Uncharacterized protein n=1 Tax=Leersia perrieri TaxID=77586 RepID=A0A0D9W4W0_9ORYZ
MGIGLLVESSLRTFCKFKGVIHRSCLYRPGSPHHASSKFNVTSSSSLSTRGTNGEQSPPPAGLRAPTASPTEIGQMRDGIADCHHFRVQTSDNY